VSKLWIGVLVAAGTVALAPRCEGQAVPGFREVGQSERVRLYTRSSSKPSRRQRADLERTDSYLARLETQLGQPLGKPVDYYRYERAEDIAAQTGVYAIGLTRIGDDVVHSTLDYHPHELVHAVAGRLGDPGRLFHEGLAVALGDEGRWGGRDVHELARARARGLDWRGLRDVFERRDADAAYPLAGSFVKHLIETGGLPRLAAFFRACTSGSRGVPAAFRVAYSRTLEDAVSDWQESLGFERKEFPAHGNASRTVASADEPHSRPNTLADLRLAPAASAGTHHAIEADGRQ
jgi:hypothetical protein